METINDVIHMIQPGVWMASVDLHHAYYSIPVHEPHRPYFSFLWKGSYYHYNCLPNGYAQAPMLFTKRYPFAYLRRQGHLSVIYMDDTYLQGNSVSSCQRNIHATVNLLQDLGFNINEQKSVLIPTQTLEFLGFILNSVTMTLTLTPRRQTNLAEVCGKLLHQPQHTIRFVSAVIGMIIAALPAVKHGALHYRSIEAEKTSALHCNGGDYDAIMTISPLAQVEVKWWYTHIYILVTIFCFHPPLLLLFT